MWTFLIAALVIVVVPGPDQALITRNALAGGRRGGLVTMLGGVSGLTVHATAAAVGLSALVAASAGAFTCLKLAGIAYLLFLAVQSWRGGHGPQVVASAAPARSAYWRQGLLSNVLNPKVALFFLTFLPQFLPAHASPLVALGFAALFAAVYIAWFSVYASLVDQVAGLLRRPRVQSAMERLSGAALAGFAARLLLERR